MTDRELSITQNKLLLDLFPPITPYSSGFLDVGDGHELYWEQSGNPDGVPVLLLHGGPGAGATPIHRQFFDPEHYRIVIFDQRGAGRSTPLGSLENNTAMHLVSDIEVLRKHLRIERWHIFGGSWGSTLALLYAKRYSQHCISMILRGVFLCEESEINWWLYGIRKVFPEAWEQFAGFFPPERHDDLLNAYYEVFTGDDENKKMQAAIRWSLYESSCSLLLPNYDTITTLEQRVNALALAKLEAHYFKHEVIAAKDSILTKIDKVRHIPTVIIHGRYDMICPLETAHKLHQAWPEADYIIVADSGHSALDPSMRSKLISATENFKNLS